MKLTTLNDISTFNTMKYILVFIMPTYNLFFYRRCQKVPRINPKINNTALLTKPLLLSEKELRRKHINVYLTKNKKVKH